MTTPPGDDAAPRAPNDPPAWPIPTDRNALARARTLARGAVEQWAKHDPDAATRYVSLANRLGEKWLRSALDTTDPGRRLTTDEAALIAQVRPVTIRVWIHRERLVRYPDGIDERELLDLLAADQNPNPPQETAA